MKSTIFFFLFSLFAHCNYAQEFQNALKFRAGANFSDPSYPIEYVSHILPTKSYYSREASAVPVLGYFAGFGYDHTINQRILAHIHFDLSTTRVEVSGMAERNSSAPSLPDDASILVKADGYVKYLFANAEVGLSLFLLKEEKTSIFITAAAAGHFLLDKKWDMDIEFETGEISHSKDLPNEGISYRGFIPYISFGMGLQFHLSERFSCTPMVQLRGTWTGIEEEDTSGLISLLFGMEGKYWF